MSNIKFVLKTCEIFECNCQVKKLTEVETANGGTMKNFRQPFHLNTAMNLENKTLVRKSRGNMRHRLILLHSNN